MLLIQIFVVFIFLALLYGAAYEARIQHEH
jgi:hypothetical protein